MIEAVDTQERIQRGLDAVSPMVGEGLITTEDVTIMKYTHRYMNPLPADKPVSEAMTRDVVSLREDMSVREAWEKMVHNELKALPVVDSRGVVIGILTDEDMLQRAGIQQRLSVTLQMGQPTIQDELRLLGETTRQVKDVMTQPVILVKKDEPLGAAAAKMVKAGLKRMPVVDNSGKLAGMLSRLDILKQVADAPSNVPPSHFPAGAVRTVGDVMRTDIPAVRLDENLASIVEKFVTGDTHRLVVINEDGLAVGLIANSDVVARVQPEHRGGILDAFRNIGKPPAGKETAADIMSPGVTTILPATSIVEAAQKMLAESRKWLVVINEMGLPVGLIDRQTLLEALVSIPTSK